MRTVPLALLVSVVLAAGSCRPAPAPPASPAPAKRQPPISPPTVPTFERGITPRPAPPLPAIPLVTGPLALKVTYPVPNEAIPVRDSNFIFGVTGNGHATLTIDGAPVRVAPNGAWVAFLPVPPHSAPAYDVVARLGADSARVVVPVRVPPPPVEFSTTGPLIVDSGSVSPRGTNDALNDTDRVRVSVRAAPGADAWVVAAGHRFPLVQVGGEGSDEHLATDVPARFMRAPATMYVSRGHDTVHFSLARVAATDTEPRFATLVANEPTGPDTDAVVIGRSTPSGTYKWMFLPGTIVQVTGHVGDNVRVRLDSQLEAWVDSVNIRSLPAGYPAPERVVGAMALVPSAQWVDVVMPVSSPPPYLLEEEMDHLTLTLYGTRATPDIIKYLQNDSLVRLVTWTPEGNDRLKLRLDLTQPPFGYLAMYDSAQRAFIFRIRRPPVITSLAHPLQGLTITVDPGHPPGGAIGPTGLTEAQAVLPIAFKLRDILQQRGANVVMTRTNMNPVDLHLRTVIARQANSDVLVAIHLNAFGEGIDPFPNVGTSTLFFQPQAEPLARLVQAGMMRELGLRDLGIHYQNIAIGRTSWMPSILCEAAFMMIPEQEYAMSTPDGQERYARGVADGIEAYFRSLVR